MQGLGDLHRRSPADLHRALAARLGPTIVPPGVDPQSSSPAAQSPTPTPSAGGNSGSKSGPTDSSSPSSSPSPSSATQPSTQQNTPSSTATSASSTQSSQSSQPSSTKPTSAAPSATSSPGASPAVVTLHSTDYVAGPSSVQSPTLGLGAASTPTPSASSTQASTSSGTIHIPVVVGAIAGTLAGLALLAFLIMFCKRRRRDKDEDEFNASIFRHQSVVLEDDPPVSSNNPRPPTMIERHVNNAPKRNFSGRSTAAPYGQPYGPGDIVQPAYGQPMGVYAEPGQLVRQPSNGGYLGYPPSAYRNPAQLARQPSHPALLDRHPSNPALLNRQPSHPAMLNRQPSNPVMLNRLPSNPAMIHRQASPRAFGRMAADPHYIDLNRSSVTPFQAEQYADISRRLNEIPLEQDPGDLPLLPSPFDNPPSTTARGPSPPSAHNGSAAPVPKTTLQVHGATDANRPVSDYSYSEGDAYGGM